MSSPGTGPTSLSSLQEGERLDRRTFHSRYEAMPDGIRAELIGGRVILGGRRTWHQGRITGFLLEWLGEYEQATPGTQALARVTLFLGPESEPEPTGCLLILPERGGATWDEDGFVAGPPELVVEVATSVEAVEFREKKDDYERAGVREYVVAVTDGQVFWFVRDSDRFVAQPRGGYYRSRVFPGLWLDPVALAMENLQQMNVILRSGLASSEHARFLNRPPELPRQTP